MFRLFIFFGLSLLALYQKGFACVYCFTFGNTRPENQSFITLFYRQALFRDYVNYDEELDPSPFTVSKSASASARIAHAPLTPVEILESSGDFKRYTTYELYASWNVADVFQLSLSVPYENNTVYYKEVMNMDGISPIRDSTNHVAGWGGIFGIIEYQIQKKGNAVTHILRPGVGKRLTRGSNTLSQSGLLLDHTVQPGVGVSEFLFKTSYSALFANTGTSLLVTYGWNSSIPEGYTGGNRGIICLSYFRNLEYNHFKLVPELSITFQWIEPDIEDGTEVEDTGRHLLTTNVSIGVQRSRYELFTTYQLPVYQELDGSQLSQKSSFSVGISRIF